MCLVHSLLVLVALIAPVTIANAAAPGDLEHGSPRVILRRTDGRPIAPDMGVSIRWRGPLATTPVGARTAWEGTDSAGVAEFAALPAGEYLVHVDGVCERRRSRHQPPIRTRRSGNTITLFSMHEALDMRRASARATWTVRTGDGHDSLVVRVRPGKWIRNVTCRVVFPQAGGDAEWDSLQAEDARDQRARQAARRR